MALFLSRLPAGRTVLRTAIEQTPLLTDNPKAKEQIDEWRKTARRYQVLLAPDVCRLEADRSPAYAYRLHGDKWFCSNPDADLAMVLARIDGLKVAAQRARVIEKL